jgi:hypothetical protein
MKNGGFLLITHWVHKKSVKTRKVGEESVDISASSITALIITINLIFLKKIATVVSFSITTS